MKYAGTNNKKKKTTSSIRLVNRLKPPVNNLRRSFRASFSEAWNSFEALTARRLGPVAVLFRLKHPIIALKLLLPGLFIGLVGSVSLAVTLNSSQSLASGPTANVWVDRATGVDTCTRSASQLDFASAAGHICKHWDAAYKAASSAANDTVRVIDGVYESQSNMVTDHAADLDSYLIRNDATKTTGTVTFTCGTTGSVEGVSFAHGASVIEGDHLTIDGGGNWRTGTKSCFRFRSMGNGWNGDSVSGDNLTLTGLHAGVIQMFGGVGDTISNNEVGPFVACAKATDSVVNDRCRNNSTTDEAYWFSRNESPGDDDSMDQTQYGAKSGCGAANSPQNLVWDNNYFHDENSRNGSRYHTGQLQNQGWSGCVVQANGLTFSRNRFERITVGGLAPSISDDNVTIENNQFGDSAESTDLASYCTPTVDCPIASAGGNYALYVNTGWGDGVGTNWSVRFNTFANGVNMLGTYSNSKMYGNIFESTAISCGSIPYSYNVWAKGSTACSGTNQQTSASTLLASEAYNASSPYDFHLTGAAGSTIADNSVPTAQVCPATDYDGDSRPLDTNCDAGSDERTAVPANHYVRAGATGNGSGSDWTNACTDFTGSCAVSSLVRGDTYYVAAGTYAARRFDTATSGTKLITIKGATAADHGTATGWLSTYGVGTAGRQATWSSSDIGNGNNHVFWYDWDLGGSAYFTFDGNTACNTTAGSYCSDPTTYGFKMGTPANCSTTTENLYLIEYGYNNSTNFNVTNNTFSHIATSGACAGSNDIGRASFSEYSPYTTLNNLTFSHDYCEEMEACIDYRGTPAHQAQNGIIEYLYEKNAYSSGTHHGEQVNLVDNVNTVTIRYSLFTGLSANSTDGGTGLIQANAAVTADCESIGINNLIVYGNVFNDQHGGNGTIGSAQCKLTNTQIYNNTFSGNANGTFWFNLGGYPGSGNVANNNLIYNMDATESGLATHDYNSYYSDTNVPAESHGQTSASNPFVNVASLDFHLFSDTSAWNNVGIPSGDSADSDGVTRTSSRGAYQYVTASNTWYVDPTATGSNNGTSWANAWTSVTSINWTSVAAGDTIYLSGGSTSQTYTNTLTVGKSGTAANPIKISAGQDAGHNGTAIFDFNADGTASTRSAIDLNTRNYITIEGSFSGSNHLQFQNIVNTVAGGNEDVSYGIGSSGGNTGILIDHVAFNNVSNGVKIASATGNTIQNSAFNGIRGNAAINVAGSTGGFDSTIVDTNYIEMVCQQGGSCNNGTGNSGPDGVESGAGVTIKNNTFKETVINEVTSGQHPDSVQGQGNFTKIYNNDFQNVGDSNIDFGYFGGPLSIDSVYIYNNTFRILTTIDPYPDFIRLYYNFGSQVMTGVTNFKVMNNVFADANAGGGIPPVNFCYYDVSFCNVTTSSGNQVTNNIFINDGDGTSSGPMLFVGSNAGTGWTAGNNVYYRPTNGFVTWKGTSYTAANFVSSVDTAGKTGLPSFTSYTAFASGNDFHINTSDTVAVDKGASLASYFTADKDGITRPQGAAWDIGAYETSSSGGDTTNPTVSMTAPANNATVSGSNTVSATASDNVGVVGVQFKLDGSNLGAEDTTSPYSINWDTTLTSNGAHQLTAVARDAAGNTATTNPITNVTVNNTSSTPVASYAMGEGSGATSADSSGNNHTLSLTNITWATGKYGNGLGFNGTTSSSQTADANSLDLPASGTIETWVKLNAINTWHGLIGKGNANDNTTHNYALEINGSTNQAECSIGDGAAAIFADSTTVLTTGTFYHLACVWDGTNLKVYVNGALEHSTPQSITPAVNTSPLYIGQFGGGFDFLNGTMDDARIYNRALSVAEVTTDMNTSIDGAGGSDTTAPTVAVTAPASGATVKGASVSVTATANDNVGVVGVQFLLDGVNQGAEDTTSPYSITWNTTTLGDGSHTITAIARDAAGNTTTSSAVTVTVDNTNPTGSLTAPASSAIVKGTISLTSDSADATSGVTSAAFQRSPAGANTWTTISTDTTSPYSASLNTTTLTDGLYDFRVVTTDNAGNSFTSATISNVRVDNTAPTSSITAPAANANIKGNSVTVSATSTDGGSGVASVQFKLDGANLGAADTTNPYSVTWDTTTALDGSHTLTAVATDNAGTTTTSSSVTVTVDNTNPTGSLTAPAASANVKGTVTVSSNSADATSGVTNAAFQRSPAGAGTWTTISTDTTSPYSASWDTTAVTDGLYDLRVVTTDNAGNTFTSATVTNVRVDNTNPTGSLTAPAASANVKGTVTVSSNSADGGSGVANVQFQLDGANLGAADTTSPYSVSWDTTLSTNGTHTLTAVTSDAAGNAFSSTAITVTVDNVAPTASLTSPIDGATVSGNSVLISANASDNIGVAGVQFQLDCPGVACGSLGAEDTTAPYSFSWDTTTLANGSTHTLTAVARDAAGNITTSSTITVTVNNTTPPPPDTTQPSVPTGLASTGTTTSSISLTWNASTDNSGGTGVAGYLLYRNGSYVTTISPPLSYTDSGLVAATSYSYQISAIDNSGNESAKSTAINVSTAANPSPPPPTYKKGDCNHDNAVNLTDLSILLSNYNKAYANADFDGNGIVSLTDLSILLSNYGK
jgi:hypothetical protein